MVKYSLCDDLRILPNDSLRIESGKEMHHKLLGKLSLLYRSLVHSSKEDI